MSELVLSDMDSTVLRQLHERATSHGRTPEEEAKLILSQALHFNGQQDWAEVDAVYDRLAASGRSFSDSAELLREDRDR